MGVVRAETIARMRIALRKGLSASRFIKDMAAVGLSYRRTDMLSDWRSVSQIEKKKGLLRYIRKDRYPTETAMARVDWRMSREYMYKVKVLTRLAPEEPIEEHFVNIMSDMPLTPIMVEERAIEERAIEEKYFGEIVYKVMPWSVVHKIEK